MDDKANIFIRVPTELHDKLVDIAIEYDVANEEVYLWAIEFVTNPEEFKKFQKFSFSVAPSWGRNEPPGE